MTNSTSTNSTKTPITISGVPKKFSAIELEQRQSGWHKVYHETSQSCERVRAETGHELLQKVIDMSAQGYTVATHLPISADYLSFIAYLVKPKAVQDQDIAKINTQIKTDYIAELQSDLDVYKQLLVAQLVQKAETREAQKVEAARAKVLEAAQKEAEEAFGSLVVPE